MSTIDASSFVALPEYGAHHYAKGSVIRDTLWGYTIHAPERASALLRAVAMLAPMVGVALIAMAAALVLLFEPTDPVDTLTLRLAAALALAVLGTFGLFHVLRPRGAETQIDTGRGQIRFGHRTRRGAFRSRHRLAFSEVTSVYLLRSKQPHQPARLFLRLGAQGAALEVAIGPQGHLEALRERLAADLRQRPMLLASA